MENTPYLYDTLVQVLSQHRKQVGPLPPQDLSLDDGGPDPLQFDQLVRLGAFCGQSSPLQPEHGWLDNDKIEVHALQGPLIYQALIGWVDKTLYVALDTSILRWPMRLYKVLLKQANTLLPFACKAVCLGDRGFADTDIMCHLKRLGWHFRLRIKANFWIYRAGHGGRFGISCQPLGKRRVLVCDQRRTCGGADRGRVRSSVRY